MSVPDMSDRFVFLAIGVLIILAPVLILILTLTFLILTGDLLLGEVTPLEFIELYIIEFILFGGFAYGLYRLILTLVKRQLPKSLDALERSDMEEATHEESHHDRD